MEDEELKGGDARIPNRIFSDIKKAAFAAFL